MTPSGWREGCVGDLVRVQGGFAFKSSAFLPHGVPIVRMSNLRDGRLSLDDAARVSEDTVRRLEDFRLRSGDVLVGLSGSLGNFGEVRPRDLPCYLNQRVGRFVPKDGALLHYRILKFLIQSDRFRDAVAVMAAGAAQLNVSPRQLEAIALDIPPLGEQRKIAAILSSVDEAIDATQAVIDQLHVVKKAMMAELLTRGLPGRHTRFKQTEIGEVPEEWEVVRMVEVADIDYGISAAVSRNKNPEIGWPIITGANLTLDGHLDLSEVVYHSPPKSPQHFLRRDDLLLNWRSGSAAHVGKTVLFDRDENYTYASFVLRIRSRGRLVPAFGHALLNYMREKEYFSRDLSQQVNFKMNATVFRDVRIRLPSPEEQSGIAGACQHLDASVAQNSNFRKCLEFIKSALMSVLLTGEVRVKPDEEAT